MHTLEGMFNPPRGQCSFEHCPHYLRIVNDETVLSHSRSYDAALSRPDALWLLYVGEVRDDGGIWSVGIPVLHETEDGGYRHIHGAGATVSAHLQDCAGASNMECDRRVGGCATHCFVCIGEAT